MISYKNNVTAQILASESVGSFMQKFNREINNYQIRADVDTNMNVLNSLATFPVLFTLLILLSTHLPALAQTAASSTKSNTTAQVESFEQIDEGEDKMRVLSLQEAQDYLLTLINKDRAEFHCPAVVFDKKASDAAQLHAYDTALQAYNDHYDPEGRSPDWRYTLLGGTQLVMENQLGVTLHFAHKFRMARRQRFSKQEIESVETAFFDEKPPKDGHRKNILNPRHNRVGIGLASMVFDQPNGEQEINVTACEEFVDYYGTFDPLPLSAQRGTTLVLNGKLDPGTKVHSLLVKRGDLPQPRKLESLRQDAYHGYTLPEERVSAIYPPNIVQDSEGAFKVEIKIPQNWKDGLYYFEVWASNGNSNDQFVASRRIVAVGNKTLIQPLKLSTHFSSGAVANGLTPNCFNQRKLTGHDQYTVEK